jgi:hypothetical protein
LLTSRDAVLFRNKQGQEQPGKMSGKDGGIQRFFCQNSIEKSSHIDDASELEVLCTFQDKREKVYMG